MEWHDTEGSDDDHGQHDEARAISRKRSSRACDQCRKTKSKCERPKGDSKTCKSCALTGTTCTFLGPSYKRGPPKGYIHAIEQRWHQVEALMGAILQCPDPRVQSIVSDLRQDDLAGEILGRVDSGPYGPSGRRTQPADATKEDFFASILRSNESAQDASRARRQSRVSREIVSSNQDHGLSVVPTREWQDNLSKRLAFRPTPSASTHFPDEGETPATRRRRLNDIETQPSNWNTLYTIEPESETDELRAASEGMGQLSLDENQEVRFHGQASGLHLLGRNERTDDRIEGGIWRLPMARVWPPSKFGIQTYPMAESHTELPPQHIQDELIELYFTNIHPIFPVIHKTRFLAEYNARKQRDGNDFRNSPASSSTGSTYSSPRPEPMQEVTHLLLFAIFAIAARFIDDDHPHQPDKMWDAGCEYLDSARDISAKVFHISRPSTVQSFLLLGYREFGIGSMEQGWIFIGTAIRMAFDLGLNCDSSKWKMHGHDLFSPAETQTRRQIWWACVLTDRYGSVYMGRPVMIKDEDFETPLPNVDPIEDHQPWQPTLTRDNLPYPPVPGRVMNAFCATSRLAVILGAIVTQIYPVRSCATGVSRLSMLADLESRLDQWYITLPDELQLEVSSKRQTSPPQILFLHVRYWGAVLILHRAFIPNWKGFGQTPQKSTIGTRAFDLAHGAACHIATIVTNYREMFTMKRSSPFLTSYLLGASIMHILALTIQPENVKASVGLQQCMTALKEMAVVWPSASRAWELSNGVHIRAHAPPPDALPQYPNTDRNKRDARDAFGEEKSSEYFHREAFGATPMTPDPVSDNGFNNTTGVQDISTRLMAHMLGLEFPGVEPSTSYFPGYEWWPRLNQGAPPPPGNTPFPANAEYGTDIPSMGQGVPAGNNGSWMPSQHTEYETNNYAYDFGQYGV